jgi:O-antigen ligase
MPITPPWKNSAVEVGLCRQRFRPRNIPAQTASKFFRLLIFSLLVWPVTPLMTRSDKGTMSLNWWTTPGSGPMMNSGSMVREEVWRRAFTGLLIIGSASLLGYAIGRGNWAFVIATLVLPLALVWPVETALGAFALIVPFDEITGVGNGTVTVTWLVGVFALVMLLMVGVLQKRLEIPPRAALWWTLLVAWGGFSAFWAIDPSSAIAKLPTALSLLLIYLATASLEISDRELSTISLFAIAGGCAAAVFAVHAFFSGSFYHGGEMRGSLVVGAKETDPNIFAASLLLPLALAVGRFLAPSGRLQKMLMLGACAVISLGMLVTQSRGAVLAMAVMIFVYLYRFRIKLRVVVPVFVCAVTFASVWDLLFTRFEKAGASGGGGRLDIWLAGLEAIKKYGLLGAGMENFGFAYNEYARFSPKFRGYSFGAHNIYLQIAVEYGVVGVLLLVAALHSQLKMLSAPPSEKGRLSSNVPFEAAGWAILSSGFFLGVLWLKSFWLVWMLLVVAGKLNRRAGSSRSMTSAAPRTI